MHKIIIVSTSFLLLGGAIIFSLFTIGKSASVKPTTMTASAGGVQPATPLVDHPAYLIGENAGTPGQDAAAPKYTSENLTAIFAQKFAEEILNRNPSGPAVVDGKPKITFGNPQEFVDRLLQEEMTKADVGQFRGVVNPGEIYYPMGTDIK